jgi:hypothetical protein
MAKVYGVHQLQLREGVSGEDLEEFVKEEMAHLHLGEGWESYLLKCDKGDWNGEHLFMAVFGSVELRDRQTPGRPWWPRQSSLRSGGSSFRSGGR